MTKQFHDPAPYPRSGARRRDDMTASPCHARRRRARGRGAAAVGDRADPAPPAPRAGQGRSGVAVCGPGRRAGRPPRGDHRRLADGDPHLLRLHRRHFVPARVGRQPEPEHCRHPGMRHHHRGRRAGAGPVGVRALGQLPQRHDLRAAPAGHRSGRTARRAAVHHRAHGARPVGTMPASPTARNSRRSGSWRCHWTRPRSRPAPARPAMATARTPRWACGRASCRWPPPGSNPSPTRPSRPGIPVPAHISSRAGTRASGQPPAARRAARAGRPDPAARKAT